MPAEEAVQLPQLSSSRHRLTLPVQATAQPPTGRRHPHTHIRRRVFGQVPSSCCSPPPPVKAGRAPSRALIRRAQRDRRVPRQLVGGSTTTQGHRTQEEPGTAGAQRGLRAAKLLPALQMLQRQPPSRVVGSATSVAPPHTRGEGPPYTRNAPSEHSQSESCPTLGAGSEHKCAGLPW